MENTRMLRGNNILRKIKYRALVWVKHNKIDVKKIQTVSINMEENKIRLPLYIYLAQNKIIVPTSNILPVLCSTIYCASFDILQRQATPHRKSGMDSS
jgi:hypothetical protein